MQSFETGPICGAQVPKNSRRRKAETSSERTSLRASLIDKCPSLASKAKDSQQESGLASTQLRKAMDSQAGVIITRQ